MITQAEKKYYTPEEYLEWEITSEERHDYRDGEIIPVTGGTPNHNEIAGNLYIALRQGLKNRAYRTFYADQRLWIPNRNLYTYPDVMVVETPLKLQPGRTDTIMNPCLIAEILSKSTRDYDRSEKFLAYRSIESFREYLIIDQYRVQVEHFVKTGNKQWLMSEYTEGEATISLNQLNVELNIADLYENVEFK
jgi:Uma2 family endonuclease